MSLVHFATLPKPWAGARAGAGAGAGAGAPRNVRTVFVKRSFVYDSCWAYLSRRMAEVARQLVFFFAV